jgi:hypothetical protein
MKPQRIDFLTDIGGRDKPMASHSSTMEEDFRICIQCLAPVENFSASAHSLWLANGLAAQADPSQRPSDAERKQAFTGKARRRYSHEENDSHFASTLQIGE